MASTNPIHGQQKSEMFHKTGNFLGIPEIGSRYNFNQRQIGSIQIQQVNIAVPDGFATVDFQLNLLDPDTLLVNLLMNKLFVIVQFNKFTGIDDEGAEPSLCCAKKSKWPFFAIGLSFCVI